MISITFVEQPESASIRHHHTVNRTRAAAALPSVIGGLGLDFMLAATLDVKSRNMPHLAVSAFLLLRPSGKSKADL